MKRILSVLLAVALVAGCVSVAPATPALSPAAGTGAGESTPEAGSTPAAGGEPAKITVAMGYIPSVQFAPFYVAQERGYFRDAGLDVTFQYGVESDLLKLVGTNQLPFMVGSGEEVVLGRSQGLPVKYVMRWYREFPVVLFAKAGAGIETPADLEGKRVGLPGLFGASYVGWEALVYASNLDPSTVNLQSIGFTQAAAVSRDQVDAAMDYIVNGPVQMRLAGEEVTVIPVSDYVDLPSNGVITNEQVIESHPEWVTGLVTALLRGISDTLADPDAAFAISLDAVPEAGGEQEQVSRAIFDESLKLWQAEASELGLSDPAAWETAAQFMLDMGLIQSPVDPNELYTNRFLEQ